MAEVERSAPVPVLVADPCGIGRAYREETARLLGLRLPLTVGLFLALMSLGILDEWLRHPERAVALASAHVAHVSACGLALVAAGLPPLRRHRRLIAMALGTALVLTTTEYHVAIDGSGVRLAVVLSATLNGLFVMLPWGWSGQLLPALAAGGGFVLRASGLDDGGAGHLGTITVLTAAATTVIGAYLLDRYRRDAFWRAALQAEEAAIAGGLMHVGEVLHRHLERPDLLEQVNQLAREMLGCDWSTTFLADDAGQEFTLAAHAGVSPDVVAHAQQLASYWRSLPLMDALRPGKLLEIADASRQTLMPPSLLAKLELASSLHTPIMRGGRLIGILVHGYRTRTGPFTVRQHRLALGIAHATAVGVENARLIADLQKASRLKSEFVATMSHELRTPLNVITGYTELLADGAFGSLTDAQQDTVARVRRSGFELLDLISATLDLGRLEAGRETVDLAPTDLEALLDELAGELDALVAPRVTVTWRLHGVRRVMTDRMKVKTILKNLAGNAIKFTPAGSVEVTVGVEGGRLALVVRDTGVGIASEHLSAIFEMFRQVDGSSTRRFGGVGLGLYIVRRLVEVLGGEIGVESRAGEGSTFTVHLPVEPAAAARAAS